MKEKEVPSFRMPPANCPKCHHLMDAASPAYDNTSVPGPGDFTFCMYCAAVLVFNEDMTVRLMEPEEVDDLHPDTIHQIAVGMRFIQNMVMQRAFEKAKRN